MDELIVVYLIYNGADSGDAFKSFDAIPALADTREPRSVSETASFFDITYSFGATLGYTRAYRLNDERHAQTLEVERQFAEEFKGLYTLQTLAYQGMPKFLTDASRAAGGNALNLPDGPYMCE